MGAYQRFAYRIGHTPLFARTAKHIAPVLDGAVHRLTGGRRTFTSGVFPTLILVHQGAKSGKTYKTPLLYLPMDDAYAIVGSNFGQAHHPAWSANLLANSDVNVEVDGGTVAVRARRVSDEEKDRLWPRFEALWPPYATYRTRAAHRNIRVFVLERR